MPAKKHDLEEKYFTTEDLAERLHMSVWTLRAWRAQDTGPRPVFIADKALYPQSEVARWEATRPRKYAARGAQAKGRPVAQPDGPE